MRDRSQTDSSMKRRRYIKALGTASVVGSMGLAGCAGGSNQEETTTQETATEETTTQETTTQESMDWSEYQLGFSTHFTAGGWITALVEGTTFYAEDQGFQYNLFTTESSVADQVTHMRQMMNQGYDGIILNPAEAEPIADVIQEATNQGIPVFTVDLGAATSAVTTHVAFSSREAGSMAANRLVEECRNQNPDQSEFEILDIRGPPRDAVANLREEGFATVIEETDGFEIAGTVNGEWSRSTSKTKALQWINSNGAPDAIYAAIFSSGLGAQAALRDQDLAVPAGEDGHIVQVQLDGSPDSIPLIEDGYIDAAFDQPNYFYGPIAVELTKRYLRNGESALPDMGSTVRSTQLSVEPAQHKGVEMWSDPIWEPAEIVESSYGNGNHPQFKTSPLVLTAENASSAASWANIWGGGGN